MHGTTLADRIITEQPTNDGATPHATSGCSLRLPSYRHSYSERYHPYGRQKRPGQAVNLMVRRATGYLGIEMAHAGALLADHRFTI